MVSSSRASRALCLWLLTSSRIVEAGLPDFHVGKFWRPELLLGKKFETHAAADVEDYRDEYENEGFLSLAAIAKVGGFVAGASTVVAAAVVWAERTGRWPREPRPEVKPAHVHRAPPAPDEGPIEEEALGVAVEPARAPAPGPVDASGSQLDIGAGSQAPHQQAQGGPAAAAASTSASSSSSSRAAEATSEGQQLEGLAGLLGPSLLRSKGTRVEVVDTAAELGGANRTVALYFSSAALERELKTGNLTQRLLSAHLEVVRRAVCAEERLGVGPGHHSPLTMVYVSLDESAMDARAMARNLGALEREAAAAAAGSDAPDSSSSASEGSPPPESNSQPTEQPATQALGGGTSPGTSSPGGGGGWLVLRDESRVELLVGGLCATDEAPQVVILQATVPAGSARAESAEGLGAVEELRVVNRAALGPMLAEGAAGFPWPTKMPLELLAQAPFLLRSGGRLSGGKGEVATGEALAGKRHVALYFSAQWCAPCKHFTPILAETYASLKKNLGNDGVEVVFVSHDSDAASFETYRASMPWPSLPFAGPGAAVRSEIARSLGVQSLPSLVVVDVETGEVVTMDGRGAVLGDPGGHRFPWPLEAVSELGSSNGSSSVAGLLDGPALVLFTDQAQEPSQDPPHTTAHESATKGSSLGAGVAAARADLEALAAQYLASYKRPNQPVPLGPEVCFFAATQPGDVVNALRELCGLRPNLGLGQPKGAGPGEAYEKAGFEESPSLVAVLLDYPSRNFYPLDPSDLEGSLQAVLRGQVQPRPMLAEIETEIEEEEEEEEETPAVEEGPGE